jgi:excisionase family DNA binding protein
MDNILIISKNDLRELLEEMIPTERVNTPEIKEKDEEVLYTTEEACKILKCSKPTLHRWKKENIVPHIRIGNNIRYKKSDLMKLIK